MPHMTGLDLVRAFRAEKALDGCALVAVSGYASDYAWATLGTGFQALLSKPVQFSEILAAIEMFAPAIPGVSRNC